ncbi:putative transcription regulator BDF1 [Aspergillus clavatus NRRL 1]|uniref:Transcription regulator BDF1, putative n=1 Tax=Aspergillus clavatus (strain ATCC 1007 / CBS 513.65 / DSM 816 / NCTC 3887 / NRRL 1 / QM 1276 / 107) TaxID=344612 RepID=A1CHZ7_ASPCL|nr:transcription regulator BDF1, putative [Aspergillus clavatus NRRL 1]EAW10502.1 transcription regulator BDF1, putative [Aspergillus clavatus NRRL 1]
MATPPPEAPALVKEDKPQLPPSPNGASATDVDRTSPQNGVTDIQPSAPINGTEKAVEDNKPTAVNGHASEKSPLTNGAGTTVSPPKSPTQPPADAIAHSTTAAAEGKPLSPKTADTTEKTSANAESTPSAPVAQKPVSTDLGEKSTSQETQASQAVSKPPTDTPSDAKVENNEQDSATVKTELPHHPSTTVHQDMAPRNVAPRDAPSVPPLKAVDQDMPDAPDVPLSPTKVSRERDADTGDEPSAKRTKLEGEGLTAPAIKLPSLPTPVTKSSAKLVSNGEAAMTKVQHKFLLKGIQSLKRMNDARFFREPVDPIKMNIPHYPQIIKHPMDLGTIERKLKNNEYKAAQAVVNDFHLMVQNAVTFNGPDHLVSQEGMKLQGTFEKQMVNLPKPDEVEEKKSKKASTKTSAARREPRTSIGTPTAPRPTGGSPQATTFALGPEGLPLIRRDSTNTDGRPKRSIHPPKRDLPYSTKPKKKKFQWELRFCQEVLDELHKPKFYTWAAPFYFPVDPVALNIPTYHSIIKKPMDLSTVQSKLKTGQYENAKEFEVDVRQIFKNCFKFNIPGDPTYMAGQRFQEIFENKWAQKSRYLEAHEPHPEHQSVSSSEEESGEEEEDSDYHDNEKLSMLQKQIEEMSRQVEAITQKKKKTPPGLKKVGKSKAGKKDSKKLATAVGLSKKDKKTSVKPSKPEKQRYVTYHEKQIISNGISSLPDKKMQEALKIIQSNVPALKGTQETEIELDIDELPNDVLLMLLKFVKKNAPHVMEEEDMVLPSAANVPAPKPKKNKPMSKYEQEAQINMLESNLSRFQGGGGGRSPDLLPSVEANDSSDDSDDDSEESEEE